MATLGYILYLATCYVIGYILGAVISLTLKHYYVQNYAF